ncbi:MAG: MFS transporter [Candidatus Korarchaeota archaeon]|nr:MFS transporter [Thermoproteota archaeon]
MRRNVAAVLLTSIITSFAGSLFGTVFNLYLLDLKYTLLEISILNAISALMIFTLSRFFGRWADISGRKGFILAGILIASLAYFIFFLILKANAVNFINLAILFAILGLAGSVGTGAHLAITTTMMERNKTGTSFGVFLGSSSLGGALGSFLSGYLVDQYGMAIVSLIVAVLDFWGALLFSSLFVESVKPSKVPLGKIFKDSWGFKISGNIRALALIYLTAAISSFGISLYGLPFSIKMYKLLGSKTTYGFITGITGLINTITPYFAGRLSDKTSKEKILIGGLIARSLYMTYLAMTWDVVSIIIFAIVPFWVFIHIPLISSITDFSTEGHESETQSIGNIIMTISSIIGTLTGGIIANIVGVESNIKAINTVLVIGAIIYFTTIAPATALYKYKNNPSHKCTRRRV